MSLLFSATEAGMGGNGFDETITTGPCALAVYEYRLCLSWADSGSVPGGLVVVQSAERQGDDGKSALVGV